MESTLLPYTASGVLPARTVLVLAPHPDDEVFGCGGALALHVAAGTPVRVAVFTDGGAGGPGNIPDLPQVRAEESREAARILGYGEPAFLGYPDRGLRYGELLVTRVMDLIRESQADLVYAPSLREMHPDHLALAMAALEAARRLGGDIRVAMYEIGVPLPPNLLVDITAVQGIKAQAGSVFKSQLAQQAYDRHISALNCFRTYTLPAAVEAAEAYWVWTAEDMASDGRAWLPLLDPETERRRKLGVPTDGRSDRPLVSVLIRSLGRPTLNEALDSLSAQTWPNLEAVVVDAGGDHPPLPETWGHVRVRLVGTGQRLDRVRAANLALDEAQGEYLILLDDDDWFDPDHLAGLMETVLGEPGCRVAYAGVRLVDSSGTPAGPVFNAPATPALMLVGNLIPIHGVLFSRELVTRHGCRFSPDFQIYEDWDFWLQLMQFSAFKQRPAVSANYRIDPAAGSGATAAAEAEKTAGRRRIYEKWLPVYARERSNEILSLAFDLQSEIRQVRESARAEAQARTEAAAAKEAELRAHIDKLQAQAHYSEELSRSLEGRLQDMTVSTSWRITAPLRAVVQLLRGQGR